MKLPGGTAINARAAGRMAATEQFRIARQIYQMQGLEMARIKMKWAG